MAFFPIGQCNKGSVPNGKTLEWGDIHLGCCRKGDINAGINSATAKPESNYMQNFLQCVQV